MTFESAPLFTVSQAVQALSAVTAEDVMAVAHKVLDRKNAVTGWLTRPATEEEAQP